MFREIIARYDGKCFECEEPLSEGTVIYWDTNERKVYCEDCGESLKD